MNVKDRYLNKLKDEKILVDLYTDNYSESDYGFIIDFNEEFLVLKKFTNESLFDGISVFRRDNITRMNWGGNDIESTFKLIYKKDYESAIQHVNLESIETIIKSIYEVFNHVTVYIQDIDSTICFIGEVEEIDDDTLILDSFGTRATLDRKHIMISIGDITRIDAGGTYEKNLQILFNKKAQSGDN
jgi:hypothetical protein